MNPPVSPSDAYVAAYEDYARSKSDYYVEAKFLRETPWGWRNARREDLIVQALARVAPSRAGRIADVGCASGHSSLRIASILPECTIVGVDVAEAFIQAATTSAQQAGAENVEFCITGPQTIDLPSSSVDVLLLAEVIEHVSDASALLVEGHRVLKLGGRLIVTTPWLNGDGTLWGRCQRALGKRGFTPALDFGSVATATHGDQHVREYSPDALASAISAAGFTVEAIRSTSRIDGPASDVLFKVARRLRALAVLGRLEDVLDRYGRTIGGRQLFALARSVE